jgi:peptide/nickel transport system ATP-binding protein
MLVCASKHPVETHPAESRRVACWLHGPNELIPEDGQIPLAREGLAVAEEA